MNNNFTKQDKVKYTLTIILLVLLALVCRAYIYLEETNKVVEHTHTSIDRFEYLTSSSIFNEYSNLDGQIVYPLDLLQDYDININIETNDGSLSLIIINNNEEEVYFNTFDNNSDDTVFLEKGIYHLHIVAQNHSGSFNIEW